MAATAIPVLEEALGAEEGEETMSVQAAFAAGDYGGGGAVAAVNAIAGHLSRQFPQEGTPDQLPNEVALL